jgi:hypothetical protein
VHRIFFAPHLTNELLTGYQSLLYANLHGLFFAQAGGPERARQHQLQGPDGTTIFHLHSAESIYGDAPDASEAHRRCQSFLQALAGFARAGGRFVWTIHEDEPADLRYFHLHGELCRALASQADLVHCQSLAAAAATGTTLGLDPRSLVTLPAGNFQPLLRRAAARRDALRDQLGLDEDQRLLLHFGRRAAYKGTDRLLDVWPEAKALPNCWQPVWMSMMIPWAESHPWHTTIFAFWDATRSPPRMTRMSRCIAPSNLCHKTSKGYSAKSICVA